MSCVMQSHQLCTDIGMCSAGLGAKKMVSPFLWGAGGIKGFRG